MRIAVVTTSYPRNAGDPSGHFVEAEVELLREAGNTVEVFRPKGRAFDAPGIAARVLEAPSVLVPASKELLSIRGDLRRSGRFDRVIAHWVLPSGFLAPRGTPLELVSHGADVRLLVRLPRVLREGLARSLLSRAESWRFVSQALWDSLSRTLSPSLQSSLAKKATVAPSPFRLIRDHAKEDAIATSRAGRPYLVSVGRLIRSKGVDDAIRHAKSVRRELLVVGDGPDRERLERLAKREGAVVSFLGALPRGETLAWMARAEALIFASREEGLSTVCREATALSVPVVHISPLRVANRHSAPA